MVELIFERTCNYWIDSGIVGLYDTLQKPVPRNNGGLGNWEKTIKGHCKIKACLSPDSLSLEGEEKQIDRALSYALEWIRLTLYDVSTEKQINNVEGVYYNEDEGIVYFPKCKPLPSASLILQSPRHTHKLRCKDKAVLKKNLSKTVKDIDGLISDLIKNNYIDKEGIIKKKFFDLKSVSSMRLADSFINRRDKIYKVLHQSPLVLSKKTEEKLGKIKGAIKSEKYQTRRNSCFPLFIQNLEDLSFCDEGNNTESKGYCITCGFPIESYKKNELKKEWLSGESKNFTPFAEGRETNRCFHSSFNESQKCWRCGFATFFSPLLLFYRCRDIDTYYILPYVPGNLKATHRFYRSLSGKRGLARVLGSDHTTINYESAFKTMPSGMPLFTLSFYYDLYNRLLPQNAKNLLQVSKDLGLIDERGAVFQTALFLKRDTGQKSFILRETTIDRSAYFIKLFTYLKKQLDNVSNGKLKLLNGLHAVMNRSSDFQTVKGQKIKRNQLQRLSVLRASQALTEGKPIYRFLLPILSSDLKKDTAQSYNAYQITSFFQKYDQWLFKKEDNMANMVEQANKDGYYLSQSLRNLGGMDESEKQNLIKRYYYAIERAASPVKFLEQVRHAYHKAGKGVPKEMVFHKEDGKDVIKKFEVYRVYFLAGMLNGMLKTQASVTDTLQEAQKKED